MSGDEGRRGDDYSTRPEIAAALTGSPVSGRRMLRDPRRRHRLRRGAGALRRAPVGVVRLTYPASAIDDRVSSKVRGILAVGLISLGHDGAGSSLDGHDDRPSAAASATRHRAGRGRRLREPRGRSTRARRRSAGWPPSFNSMTEQISTLVERQRSFAGDASHQLRTPLTALRLQLERAAVNIDTDPAAARGDIEAASEETERLQRLVEGLLMLARADQGTLATETDRRRRHRHRTRGRSGRRSPRIAASSSATGPSSQLIATRCAGRARADRRQLHRQRTQRQRSRQRDHRVGRGDDGWVIDPRRRSRARHADRSTATRIRSVLAGVQCRARGSGLGLAIVRQLAEASGGEVALANRAGGGLDASVRLPPDCLSSLRMSRSGSTPDRGAPT